MNASGSESSKWKSKLLSSSVPLEYEAAKKLAQAGFLVSSDFTYGRRDLGVSKDFSVDISATKTLPVSGDPKVALELLVECKYRHPAIKWLFFPDPNESDYTGFMAGTTLHCVDTFTGKYLPRDGTVGFDSLFVNCYKGVEVDTVSGSAHESEIAHGLAQLQYAMPQLYVQQALFNAGLHEVDNLPFLLCPILLTTAKLLAVKGEASIESIKQADSIEDISKEVPYLVVRRDSGPDFREHCTQIFKQFEEMSKAVIDELDAYKLQSGEYPRYIPSRVIEGLMNGSASYRADKFSQFVVCNFEHFEYLLISIKRSAQACARGIADKRKPLFTKKQLAQMKEMRDRE